MKTDVALVLAALGVILQAVQVWQGFNKDDRDDEE